MKLFNRLIKSTFVSILFILLIAMPSFANEYYVAIDGSDLPDHGSEESPYRSITFALTVADTASGTPHTIHVGPGTFSPGSELFPLPMVDETTIRGAGPEETIVDADGALTSVVAAVENVNWGLDSLTIAGGIEIQGGGIRVTQGSGVSLTNLVIRNNAADYQIVPGTIGEGGGLFLFEVDDVFVEHVLIHDNYSVDEGAGIYAVRCDPVIRFCTISNNSSLNLPEATAIYSNGNPGNHAVNLSSSIVWGNPNHMGDQLTISGQVQVSYSLVETSDNVFPGTGNVKDDPYFYSPNDALFGVLQGSRTVDMADPEAPFDREPEPNGGRANAGYYGNTIYSTIAGAQYTLERNRWSFIGLPVSPENGDPGVLFGDELGPATGDETWRLMRWNSLLEVMLRYGEPEEDGLERGDPPDMMIGMGYLVRQTTNASITIFADGYAMQQGVGRDISLDEGNEGELTFTMAANPFPYSISYPNTYLGTPSGDMTFQEAADEGFINRWVYTLDDAGRFVPTLGEIDPWDGALLITLDDTPISWKIPPGRESPSFGDPYAGMDWGVRMNVASFTDNGTVEASDNGHIIGIGTDAQNGPDAYDAYDIRFVDRALHVRFIGSGMRNYFHQFQSNGPGFYRNYLAEVEAIPTLRDSIEISFQGLEEVDEAFGFQLANENGNEVLVDDLRTTPTVRMRIPLRNDDMKRVRFRIIVSHPDWTNSIGEQNPTTLPGEFTLDSVYPNPFNSTTALSVTLPTTQDVSLRVYDLLGRLVDQRNLTRLQPGSHRIAWQAEGLASGVYFLRLESGNVKVMHKVMLVR
ncbi:T9SS type A sorting domain-containing protein [bacterium]|nr:T9SS type A sorting domain-containing protein [bacterium]